MTPMTLGQQVQNICFGKLCYAKVAQIQDVMCCWKAVERASTSMIYTYVYCTYCTYNYLYDRIFTSEFPGSKTHKNHEKNSDFEKMMEFSCRWMSLDHFFFIFWASFAPQHTATLCLLRDSTRDLRRVLRRVRSRCSFISFQFYSFYIILLSNQCLI